MSKLPETWEVIALSEIAADYEQNTPSDEDEFYYIDISSIDRDKKIITKPQKMHGRNAPSRARKYVKTGDVLISLTRPNLNTVAIVPEHLNNQVASTGFDVLRVPEVDPRWLLYIVQSHSFVTQMSELVQGALYPAINVKDVRAYKAPFAPLREQKRIIDKVDTILKQINKCRERLDKIPSILKRLRQSILNDGASGKLIEGWKDSLDSSEWERVSIDDITLDVFDGPFGSNLKSNDYTIEGIQVIRLENIGWLKYNSEKSTFISLGKYESLRKNTLKKGDILFSSFIAEEVRVCLLPDDLSDKAINKADCFCIRTMPNICLPEFLMILLASRSTFKELEQEVHGATRPRINLKHLRSFEFMLPSLNEQKEIIKRVKRLLTIADRIQSRHNAAYSQIEKLSSSLIGKALRGQLVAQDLNDEPAMILIEAIREKRAKHAIQPKQRKTTIKKKKITTMLKLEDVLAKENDWVETDEAFRRCGISDGLDTIDQIEKLYAELRTLEKSGRLEVEALRDEEGRKWHDRLKLRK